MRSTTKILGLCLAVAASAGCAGNPLIGHWNATYNNSSSTGTQSGTVNAEIRADGTLNYTISVSQLQAGPITATCTGSLMFTQLMWSSTMTVLTVTGPGMCTGMITCTVGTFSANYTCEQAMMSAGSNPVGTYNYSFGANNMTLTVTPTGGGNTTSYTRAS